MCEKDQCSNPECTNEPYEDSLMCDACERKQNPRGINTDRCDTKDCKNESGTNLVLCDFCKRTQENETSTQKDSSKEE